MEFDSIRPIVSGVIGGAIATWLTARLAKNLPSHYGSMPRELLAKQHRPAIWIANVFFFVGLFAGIALYKWGGYENTDWRPLLLGFGLASVLPLLSLVLVSVLCGRKITEAFVAFAWGQGSPLWATYGILGAGVVAFAFGVAALGT